ncbi:hypothetical protein C8250_004310 [Streptomyces sp. So13.3]|nr:MULTISPECIES: hypothetical protein [Streptomyces]MCZ4095160.1 hypothetical protein [Streptomyces sp. H39-C1]QNA71242.1 hypothetical protein C8250_004310 [Streptomyces sp. So13.3]
MHPFRGQSRTRRASANHAPAMLTDPVARAASTTATAAAVTACAAA